MWRGLGVVAWVCLCMASCGGAVEGGEDAGEPSPPDAGAPKNLCADACEHLQGVCTETSGDCARTCKLVRSALVDCEKKLDALLSCSLTEPRESFVCNTTGVVQIRAGKCTTQARAFDRCAAAAM
ncbi:MAG TPA: hypothetical protein VER33_24685 [Polyangiaceae bacterium]|nr:hypothetical protein [Polyangiaceae bacterium]